MRIMITAATHAELQPAMEALVNLSDADIQFYVTGIGMLATAVSLTKIIMRQQPDLVIQIGIAGTFNNTLTLGKVIIIKADYIGDMGVEEDGVWKDIFDLNLIEADSFPYTQKAIINPYLLKLNNLKLDEVDAITVNEISTNKQRIKQLQAKYNATIESMEGAALHYVCKDLQVQFLQIRSISNYIGERDKTKWQMHLAITNLNETLIELITNYGLRMTK